MAFRQRVTGPSADQLTARFLVARVGESTIGIWADTVRGVLTPAEVPCGQDVLLLGERYAHTGLAVRLGLIETQMTSTARTVLCAKGQARCSITVDDVIGLTDVRRVDVMPLPLLFQGRERTWFRGLFLFQDSMALVVNPDWMLNPLESEDAA